MLKIILKFFGKIGEYLLVLLKENVKDDLEKILPMVLSYVNILKDNKVLLNSEKRQLVFDNVIKDLKDSDSVIASSVVNLAIELAVQKSKESDNK